MYIFPIFSIFLNIGIQIMYCLIIYNDFWFFKVLQFI